VQDAQASDPRCAPSAVITRGQLLARVEVLSSDVQNHSDKVPALLSIFQGRSWRRSSRFGQGIDSHRSLPQTHREPGHLHYISARAQRLRLLPAIFIFKHKTHVVPVLYGVPAHTSSVLNACRDTTVYVSTANVRLWRSVNGDSPVLCRAELVNPFGRCTCCRVGCRRRSTPPSSW